MKICGLDFETTWTEPVDPKKSRILEIGAVIYDDEDWQPQAWFSKFILDESLFPIGPEITELTGITEEMLRNEGVELIMALAELSKFAEDCAYFLAHNKSFDEVVLKSELERISCDPKTTLKFICSALDVPHDEKKRCKKLSHLALDYGVAVDPSGLHRAVNDVELMGKMMKAGGFKIQGIVDHMDIPWVYLEAVIPVPWKDGGKGKDAAKARGFRWEKFYHNEPEFPKKWVKKIKQDKLEAEKANSPFPIMIIEERDYATAARKTT